MFILPLFHPIPTNSPPVFLPEIYAQHQSFYIRTLQPLTSMPSYQYLMHNITTWSSREPNNILSSTQCIKLPISLFYALSFPYPTHILSIFHTYSHSSKDTSTYLYLTFIQPNTKHILPITHLYSIPVAIFL
jgi:hypothetical protein